MLFVRCGWLEYYDQDLDADDPEGGGAYNRESVGSEANNFKIVDGKCYGYARTGKKDGYNLSRCWPGGTQPKSGLTGVLVVVVAKRAFPDGGQVIVGWFRDARLHDACLKREDLKPNGTGPYGAYNFEAESVGCLLLPLNKRTFVIPKGAGGMGQANVYYCFEEDGTPRGHRWIFQAIDFVQSYKGPNLMKRKTS